VGVSPLNALGEGGKIIYIHVDFEEISRRLTNIKTRGIVIKKGNTLREVYEERLPLYLRYSDKTIDCTNRDIEECVNEIVNAIQS
jgi:shikimate kinase